MEVKTYNLEEIPKDLEDKYIKPEITEDTFPNFEWYLQKIQEAKDSLPKIDLSQLEEYKKNRKVYSYAELCKILKEPRYPEGKNKEAQLEKWSWYFEYSYKKNFRIIQKYEEPLYEKYAVNYFYSELKEESFERKIYNILVLSMYYEVRRNPDKRFCKISEGVCRLYQELGFVNSEFFYPWEDTLKTPMIEEPKTETEAFYNGCVQAQQESLEQHLYEKAYYEIAKIVRNVFKRLTNQKKIGCFETITVCTNEGVHEASNLERMKIIAAEGSALHEMGFTTERGVFAAKKQREYYKLVHQLVQNEGLIDFWKSYDIWAVSNFIVEDAKFILKDKFAEVNEQIDSENPRGYWKMIGPIEEEKKCVNSKFVQTLVRFTDTLTEDLLLDRPLRRFAYEWIKEKICLG